MNNYNSKELYCSSCGSTKEAPLCCTKEMELDKTTFFCEVCGKEEKVPQCCGEYMKLREKED